MVFRALQKVFQKYTYILLAFVISVAVFIFAVWFPNIPLIVKIMGHPGITFSQKINLPISLIGSIKTNFTLFSASYTILIAVFFGINIAMIFYFLKHRISKLKKKGITTSFLGIVSGVIGMGCAACGSLLITSILSLFGASWILLFLPLAGGEFAILSVILLGISIYMTSKQIENSVVCRVKY